MASVLDQPAPSRSWAEKLFFPLHIKLPVEIMALLIVCITGYYLANPGGDEVRQAVPQLKSSVPGTLSPQTPQTGQPMSEELPKSQPDSQTTDPSGLEQKTPASRQVRTPRKRPVSPPTNSVQTTTETKPAVSKPAPQPESGFMNNAPKTLKSTVAPGSVTETKGCTHSADVFKPAGQTHTEKVTSESTAPDGNKQSVVEPARLTIRLQPVDDATAESNVREAAKSTGGNVEETDIPSTSRRIRVKLPANNAGAFLEKLERAGKIEQRPAIPASPESVELEVAW